MKLVKFVPLSISIVLLLSVGLVYVMCDCKKDSAPQKALEMSISTSQVPDLLHAKQFIEIIPAQKNGIKIVHIFTTWCGCCKKEIPDIATISKTHDIIGLVWTDKPQDAIEWLNQNGNPYKQVGLIGDKEAVDLGISKAPVTIVIGDEGKVLYTHQGKLTKKDFDEIILPYTKHSH